MNHTDQHQHDAPEHGLGMTATVLFLALYVMAVSGYLMLFEFSRDVLLGHVSATGPAINFSLLALLTMMAGIGFLHAHRRNIWLGLSYAILSPIVFATLFVEAVLLYYWCSGQSSPGLVPPDDFVTWLWLGPMTVALHCHIFLPPALLGSLMLALFKKFSRGRPGIFG